MAKLGGSRTCRSQVLRTLLDNSQAAWRSLSSLSSRWLERSAASSHHHIQVSIWKEWTPHNISKSCLRRTAQSFLWVLTENTLQDTFGFAHREGKAVCEFLFPKYLGRDNGLSFDRGYQSSPQHAVRRPDHLNMRTSESSLVTLKPPSPPLRISRAGSVGAHESAGCIYWL